MTAPARQCSRPFAATLPVPSCTAGEATASGLRYAPGSAAKPHLFDNKNLIRED